MNILLRWKSQLLPLVRMPERVQTQHQDVEDYVGHCEMAVYGVCGPLSHA